MKINKKINSEYSLIKQEQDRAIAKENELQGFINNAEPKLPATPIDPANKYLDGNKTWQTMGSGGSIDAYTKSETDVKLNVKVDKIDGKQLSTNDYTTVEKNKLAGLNNYDDTTLNTKIDNEITRSTQKDSELETSLEKLKDFRSWNNSKAYVLNDVVYYDKNFWISIHENANTNHAPTMAENFWKPLNIRQEEISKIVIGDTITSISLMCYNPNGSRSPYIIEQEASANTTHQVDLNITNVFRTFMQLNVCLVNKSNTAKFNIPGLTDIVGFTQDGAKRHVFELTTWNGGAKWDVVCKGNFEE